MDIEAHGRLFNKIARIYQFFYKRQLESYSKLIPRFLPILDLPKDAKILEEAGCFGIVLEKIPSELAAEVTQSIKIPTIGIGAGNEVDGQVLVSHDMLGINVDFSPRFLRRYHNLHDEMIRSFLSYIHDVKSSDFPNDRERY